MFLGVCVHVYVCAYMSVERGRRIEKPTATTINVIEFVYMLRIFQHKQNRFNYNLKANEKVFVSLLLVATPFAWISRKWEKAAIIQQQSAVVGLGYWLCSFWRMSFIHALFTSYLVVAKRLHTAYAAILLQSKRKCKFMALFIWRHLAMGCKTLASQEHYE